MKPDIAELVKQWGKAERNVDQLSQRYAICAHKISERITYLDDHPPEPRTASAKASDKALVEEQRAAGAALMEAESEAHRLLATLRCAVVEGADTIDDLVDDIP